MSSDWPLFVGVLVDARTARFLRELIEPGRRQLRVDGRSLQPHEQDLLTALDRLAANAPAEEPKHVPLRAWVTVSEAAARLGVSTRRVTTMLTEGHLRGEKVLRSWRVDPDDLALVVECRRSEQSEPPTESADERFCA